MASTPLACLLLSFFSFLFILSPEALAATPSAPAPSSSGPINVTGLLDKNGQYTTFIRLLTSTQVANQIENQLNTSTQGMTILAPTDNAFNNLKAGTLNSLTTQEQVDLVLYHVLPQYYTLDQFSTVSNPVRTQASFSDGSSGLNFTAQSNQVNVSSGLVTTQINNALTQEFPLAMYQVDKVLLPNALFGVKSPSTAPSSPATTSSPKSSSTANDTTNGTTSSQDKSGSVGGRSVGLGFVVGLIGFVMCMGSLSL